MDVAATLERIITLLKEEKRLLGLTLSDASYVEELNRISEEKQRLVATLAQTDQEALAAHDEAMQTIRELGSINMQIAQSNMLFIEELFSSIFKENTSQYDESGTVAPKKAGLINKKI